MICILKVNLDLNSIWIWTLILSLLYGRKDPADQLHVEADKVPFALDSHIVVSRKNQEEIFASLSRNDFKKIISNLEDDGQRIFLLR